MKYNEFKELVMAAAKTRNLEEYELYYTESESLSAEALQHELNAFSTAQEAGACFRCIHGGKMGYAATELFTAEEAERIVDDAMANAESIENDESAFIHEAGDTYEKIDPVKTTEPASAELIDLVMRTQEAALAQDSRVSGGTQSMADFSRSTVALCNSKGLDLSYTRDCSMLGCFAIVTEGEEMFDGTEYKAADFTELNADVIAEESVKDALSGIGADTVTTGTYPIIFSNKMTATLLATFLSAFSAESAQRGLSLLNGKEGEQIASPIVTVTDDPFREDSLIRIPFDGEGVATRRKNVIENGRLNTLLHNLTTAHKAGIPSTGNGMKGGYAAPVSILPFNFYMEKGEAGQKEDIFQTVQNGIYVTELNGLHAGANPVTGDFSLSSAGFLVENGEKTRPVKNFTISGNFYELLQNIALVGSDLEFQAPRMTCCFGGPTIMVKDVAVAGK